MMPARDATAQRAVPGRLRRAGRLLLLGGAVWLAAALAGPGATQAQTNFKPLERSDIAEVEQRLVMVRGLEVEGEYALRIVEDDHKNLSGEAEETQFDQDFRLKFRTVFNELLSMHLTLETVGTSFNDANTRNNTPPDRKRTAQSGTTLLNAREVFLRYRFNPRSAIDMGKHEVSLGDLRGKTFLGIVPGINFQCKVGTWCMPFGMIKIGPGSTPWTFHWALQYNAWDSVRNGFRHALSVAVFRIIYTEHDIPLGKNLGPTCIEEDGFVATDFDTSTVCGRTQMIDDGSPKQPIFYDSEGQDYFGIRANWEAGQFFFNFDITANQGKRVYHLYRDPDGAIAGSPTAGQPLNKRTGQTITGIATEMEVGFRTAHARFGMRYMNATGDECVRSTDRLSCLPVGGGAYLRGLDGYYEITPGSYGGARLYFNGTDSNLTDGSGLGHSINNTRLAGVFFDFDDPKEKKFSYRGGLYQLNLNHPIPDQKGRMQDDIGLEWDNLFSWYLHKNLKFQLEANVLRPAGAFRFDDFSSPALSQSLYVQGLTRLIYGF